MKRLLIMLLALVCCQAWAQTARPADAPRASTLVKVADGRLLAPDIARIVNRGKLIVSMLATDNPPFFANQNGTLVGTDVDLAKMIARELGVEVQFDRSYKTFDSVSEAVALGNADVAISRLGRTLKRAQTVHFSNTYIKLGQAFLINRIRFAKLAGDRPMEQVIRDFDGELGVLAGSSWEEFGRRNFPKAKQVPFASWSLAVEAAKNGDVVAVYRDELEVRQLLKKEPGLALTLRTVTFSDLDSPLSVIVGVGDPTLLSFVNELIAQRAVQPTATSVLKSIPVK
jgi:ABC-type amino acid transport substrate-binding protein